MPALYMVGLYIMIILKTCVAQPSMIINCDLKIEKGINFHKLTLNTIYTQGWVDVLSFNTSIIYTRMGRFIVF